MLLILGGPAQASKIILGFVSNIEGAQILLLLQSETNIGGRGRAPLEHSKTTPLDMIRICEMQFTH